MEFTKEQLEKLREEIVLGSLYTADFENSFDIPAKNCQDFFDGFNDYLGELMIEDGHDDDEYWDIIEQYDTIDNLWNWYNCIEYPFGMEVDYE